jgi:hypothetical protein
MRGCRSLVDVANSIDTIDPPDVIMSPRRHRVGLLMDRADAKAFQRASPDTGMTARALCNPPVLFRLLDATRRLSSTRGSLSVSVEDGAPAPPAVGSCVAKRRT